MTIVLNAIFLGSLALTPQQRWSAAGDRLDTGFISEHWFMLTAAVIGIVLSLLLLAISRNRVAQQRGKKNQMFSVYAAQSGLSERERQLLLGIASKADLKQSEAIFTMSSAFERGEAIMLEESAALHYTEAQLEQLKAQLFFLREKLGFQKRAPSSIGMSTKPKRLNSRQIPVGKKIYMVSRRSHHANTIESNVIENNDAEIVVKVTNPVKVVFGEVWCVRYYFGASVWEFDTSVVSCNGDVLVLNHSDEMRFVNRRRFLRVPVRRQAFVAYFPFTRKPVSDSHKGMKSFRMYRSSTGDSGSVWGPPEFIPAVVTELAGPGLCLEAQVELTVGDRVLVVFGLDDETRRDSALLDKTDKAIPSNIVEDVGVVRHVKAIDNGFSIAVELTGLSDSDVNELIRATNAASLRTIPGSQGAPVSGSAGINASETVAAQGV
ncbi:MAG: hypothetical protein ACYS32_00165 [Planctomycetota bacterium]